MAGVEENGALLLAGGPGSGVDSGARFDLFRDGAYVGMAVVRRTALHLQAEIEPAFMRAAPRVGDEACLRLATGDRASRGWIFRLEGDYGLVSLGEADGVVRGQRLFTQGHILEVRTVYPYHCGVNTVGGNEAETPERRQNSVGGGALSLWAVVSTMPARVVTPAIGDDGQETKSAETPKRTLFAASAAQQSDLASWLYAVSAADPLAVGDWVSLPTPDRTLGRVIRVVSDSAVDAWAVRVDGWRHGRWDEE